MLPRPKLEGIRGGGLVLKHPEGPELGPDHSAHLSDMCGRHLDIQDDRIGCGINKSGVISGKSRIFEGIKIMQWKKDIPEGCRKV